MLLSCVLFILGCLAVVVLLRLYSLIYNFRCSCPVSLIGKTAVITGGSQGLGYEIVLALAAKGCRVIIATRCPNESLREEIIKKTHNPNIFLEYVDLQSYKSVRKFAQTIREKEAVVDILILNAGFGGKEKVLTEDKISHVLQTNYFSCFLLAHLFIEPLKKSTSPRILWTSSILAFLSFLRVEDVASQSFLTSCGTFTYNHSKFLQIVASDLFAERLKKHGITSNAWHPLICKTQIFEKSKKHGRGLFFILCVNILAMLGSILKTAREGAQTGIHLACSDQVSGITGKFFAEGAPRS
ncbi:unnamed protein product [Callosobruchus maculatus]|uniref:Uncharacterized protein n=1 Tax=Callosobruchus maculatus TaxID=64391 RepID=A0A653BH97_CALMS|nr:unnamed protein product [Callosobruchus maculatus]